ncbi:MAG: hypothetical protein JXA33_07130 [Anaerolineae bacterium]|nr:hypothetical protein [Anaerolineae bacterium]
MNPLTSLSEYERFIYTLQQHYPAILRSTLVLIRRGSYYADVRGELMFADDYRLVIFERLRCLDEDLTIAAYGYEIWHANEKLCWYDSQAHPHDVTLASTHPHHKHVPPDIKHHRIPAPGLSFMPPNLPSLIEEVSML